MAANTSDKLQHLRQILAEVTDLTRAAMVLEWDQETYMPPGGVQGRAEQLSTLLTLSHVKFTSDEVGKLIEDLEDELASAPFDSDDASIVRVTRRDYDQARKLPPELVAEIARAGSVARPVWEKARHDENFGLFAPYLEKNVELNRRIADALGYKDRPYDALIDRSEPGMTTAQLRTIFDELKAAIVPLVADIKQHADAVDDSVLYRGFDPDLQVSYALNLVKRLGYDLERGRQHISTHPFSTGFGPGDVRITTRVSRDFFNECLFGSIHESGHAMYNQGMGREIDRTPLWDGASPGIHESQSRLWDRRSEPRLLAPLLPQPEVRLPRAPQGRRGRGLLPRGQQVTPLVHPRRGGRGHVQHARPPPLRAGERAARGQAQGQGRARGVELALQVLPRAGRAQRP